MTGWSALVPELTVTDVEASLAFYRAAGFAIRYRRSSPAFAHIELGQAQLMLEQDHPGGWKTADLSLPFGRGIDFQIEVYSGATIVNAFAARGIPLFREPAEVWYETSPCTQAGKIEVLAQDPDGYLMRFVEVLGARST